MELKYRAADGKPLAYSSPPYSSSGYFFEHAFRAAANYQIIDPEVVLRNEILNREMEKEKIREEIIAKEMMMRRIMEAEVRRELMIERAIAMRAVGANDMSEKLTMRLEPPPTTSNTKPSPSFNVRNQFDNRWLGDGSPAFPGRDFFHQSSRGPTSAEAWVGSDVKAAAATKKEDRGKIVPLAKPDPNLCGVKRKAATPHAGGADELPCAGLKKKPKDEWSCALCHISATSEQGLKEHLQGKKHKAKGARLRADKMAKNPSFESLPKKTLKQTKVNTADLELGTEAKGESVQVYQNIGNADKKLERTEVADNENGKPQVHKNKHAKKKSKKNNTVKKVVKEQRTAEFKTKKKFKFWCEMCRIGAYSAVVMETHNKGKRHLAQLQQLNPNGEVTAEAASSSKGSEKANQKMVKNAINNENAAETFAYYETTKENVADNEKKAENVFTDIDGSRSSVVNSK